MTLPDGAESPTAARLDTLGTYIRGRRRELGLTQTQLAERIGWVQERISLLENGKYGMPSVTGLSRLAAALDTSLADLLHAAGYATRQAPMGAEEGVDHQSDPALFYALQKMMMIDATSLKSTLDQAADMVAEVMNAEKVDALVYEAETDTLVALGCSNTPMGRRQFEIGMNRMPIANGGREDEVFRTGKSFYTGRASNDPAMLPGTTEGLGVQSLVAVPLDVAGRRRGVLVAETSVPDCFSGDDVPFLETVARWVGMVAHRAELVEATTADATANARRAVAEELMTVLAHDLNNHLTPLKGQVDLLHRRAVREEHNGYLSGLEQSKRALGRVQHLVEDLLDTARLEQGVFGLSHKPVDLVQLAHDVVQGRSGDHKTIALRLPDSLVVQADASRICQVLENLLGNAIEHSPDGVPINVSLRTESQPDREYAVVEVEDEGPGIPTDVLPTLFNRFAKGTTSQGMGLGLYVSRGIAEAHGGTLIADSKPGKGSSFRLSLPLSRPTADSS